MCQTVVFGEQLFSVLDDIQAVPYTHAMYMWAGKIFIVLAEM
jgi:hypothetical protein